WSLVKALQLLPCMGSQSDRNFVVRLLNDRLGPLQIDESPKTQPHILSIVEVCSRRPDGFDALWDIISELDQGISHLQAVERPLFGGGTQPGLRAALRNDLHRSGRALSAGRRHQCTRTARSDH